MTDTIQTAPVIALRKARKTEARARRELIAAAKIAQDRRSTSGDWQKYENAKTDLANAVEATEAARAAAFAARTGNK